MGCGNCGSSADGSGCSSPGCGQNGSCSTGACNKLNTYDWLNHMSLPSGYKPFDVVEVRFKGSRKEYYRNSDALDLYTGDMVVVESDYGHDVGEISLSGELVRLQLKKNGIKEDADSIRKIYRKVSDKDFSKYNEVKDKESATLERARTIAMDMRLAMKLSDIEFQGDGRKVIFYYTAEKRVDFRALIKQYAAEFRTRIEMRQVSYREEASRLGGIGSCGRELCCSTWLTDYKVVTMGTAKTQNLSINMLKLSGQCGRLKCCLNYELETYLEALDEFPKGDQLTLETGAGSARLQKTDILKRKLWFSYPGKSEWIPISLDRVNEIREMNKEGQKPETLVDQQIDLELLNPFEPAPDLISDQDINRYDKIDKERKKKNRNKRFKSRSKNKGPRGKKGGGNQNRRGDGQPQGKGKKGGPKGAQQGGQGGPKKQNRRPKNKNRKPNSKPPQA